MAHMTASFQTYHGLCILFGSLCSKDCNISGFTFGPPIYGDPPWVPIFGFLLYDGYTLNQKTVNPTWTPKVGKIIAQTDKRGYYSTYFWGKS